MSMNKTDQNKRVSLHSYIKIIIESWRLKNSFERVISLLDAKEQKKNISRIKWFENKLSEALYDCELKIVTFNGDAYSSGIPATPVNIDEFDSEKELFISQTIEPTIIDYNGTIVHQGSIILKKV